jgi:hypothetical protein
MLKQINIGGKMRPIHFGYAAKRRLDPIILSLSQRLMAANDDNLDPTQLGITMYTDLEFQIQLLKIGLEEGQRVASKALTIEGIDETEILDWLDENPEAILEAITIYSDQQMTIAAKKAGEDPEKFKARMMGTTNTQEKPNGTPSSASALAGSD